MVRALFIILFALLTAACNAPSDEAGAEVRSLLHAAQGNVLFFAHQDGASRCVRLPLDAEGLVPGDYIADVHLFDGMQHLGEDTFVVTVDHEGVLSADADFWMDARVGEGAYDIRLALNDGLGHRYLDLRPVRLVVPMVR